MDLVARQLNSDFDDISVIKAGDSQLGLELSRRHIFDAVVCGREEFLPEFQHCLHDLSSPLVVLEKAGTPAPIQASPELENLKTICLDSNWRTELSALIRSSYDPRKERRERRFHVPGLVAEVSTDLLRMEAPVVNFNSYGLLLETVYSVDLSSIINGIWLALHFPKHYPYDTVDRLQGALVRLNVLADSEGGRPSLVRLAYAFCGVTSKQKLRLIRNMELAARETDLDLQARLEPVTGAVTRGALG